MDSGGRNYDNEIQRADRGAGRRRARFHSAVLDSRMLQTKAAFSELCDSYVIFITENDVLKKVYQSTISIDISKNWETSGLTAVITLFMLMVLIRTTALTSGN